MAGRITQETIESLQLPGTAHARITQEAIEAAEIPLRSGVHARITQQPIEALDIPLRSATNMRMTQQAIEVLYILGINVSQTQMLSFVYPTIAQVGPFNG
jgi:hypothetical protein